MYTFSRFFGVGVLNTALASTPVLKAGGVGSLTSQSSLTVFFPAFNEEGNIRGTVESAVTALNESPYIGTYEILVIDDASTDHTRAIVTELAKIHPQVRCISHSHNHGYGAALKTGFKHARMDYVFFTDADMQFDITELRHLLEHLNRFDVVIGYRAPRRDPFIRLVNAWGWNFLNRILFGLRVHDIDCAFKLFKRDLLQSIQLRSQGAMISAELLIRLTRYGVKIKEVPVSHFPRTAGTPTGAKPSVIFRALREMVMLYIGDLGSITQKQALKFMTVGIVNTLLDIVAYLALTRGTDIFSHLPTTAKFLSFFVGTVSSFILNRVWTFGVRTPATTSEVGRFYASISVSLVINVAVMYVLVNILGIYDLVALVMTTVFTFFASFTLARVWVFRAATEPSRNNILLRTKRDLTLGNHANSAQKIVNTFGNEKTILTGFKVTAASYFQTLAERAHISYNRFLGRYAPLTNLSLNNSLHKQSAQKILNSSQVVILAGLCFLGIFLFIFSWHTALVSAITVLTILYFLDLMFNLSIIFRSSFAPMEISVSKEEISGRKSWPRYTILCPLYGEAQVLPQFIKAMDDLDYPKDKLEILLILEEDDEKTIDGAREMSLHNSFKIIIVPHSLPKTKPKACNHGLIHTTGTYAVIFDAEDIPAPDQLKKAVLAFEKTDEKTICLQAKLNYYNPHQNLLTRLFTLEYSLWFEVILTGLQSVGGPIPLGGTSNHFRAQYLHELKGWDPFNVTEDADLGMRIAKSGYKTAIIDSVTMEEANSQLKNWFKQRSRWIKGYMQTYLVHMQTLFDFTFSDFVMFQLVVGGKVLTALINPFMWLMTIAFFISRSTFGGFISSLYVGPILYIGVFTLIIGNFIYAYIFMIGVAKRKHWNLVKYGLLAPFYWLIISFAAYYGLWELLVRPFHWNKTKHGLHFQTKPVPIQI